MFGPKKISLLELAANISMKNEEKRQLSQEEIVVRKSVKKKRTKANKIKVVKDGKDSVMYYIPDNMHIKSFKNKVEENMNTIISFMESKQQAIEL